MKRRLASNHQSVSHRRFDWLNNLSIRRKLLVSFTLLILLLIFLATLAYVQIAEIQRLHMPARNALREMQQAVLRMQVYEQELLQEVESSSNAEFYLKRQSKNHALWEESYVAFEQNYNKLHDLSRDPTVISKLETVKPRFVEYRDYFLQFVKKYQQRGFNNFGREGALRLRANELEEKLTAPQDIILLLQLRRYEKNFFLRKEIAQVQDFNNDIVILKSQLVSAESKLLLDEYAKLFQEIVVLDEEIGLSASTGLRGKMQAVATSTAPVLADIEDTVLKNTVTNIENIKRTLRGAAFFCALLAVGLAFMIARSFNHKIAALLVAAKRVTAGNLRTRITLQSKDELGELAAAFNTMTVKLEASQRDLHERAEDLAASVQKFELVSKAVNEAVYEWDIRKATLDWGKGLQTVFGYTQDKTTVDWWAQQIHPDDAMLINTSLDEHFDAQKEAWSATYRMRRSNGTYAIVQDRGFIEYEKSEPVRMVGSIIDITRQKEIEQAKDMFTSLASHQLRTPLTAIRLFTEMLVKGHAGQLNATQQGYVEKINISILRMIELVSDMLNVTRVSLGRLKIEPTPTHLETVISERVEEIKPVAAQKGVSLRFTKSAAPIPELPIDTSLLGEVVHNLLTNAVRYSPAKTGRILIALESKPDGYIISVKDNGIGIPKEAQRQIFTSFFRADNAVQSVTEGNGLGLYLVKMVMDLSGGDVWFDSVEGKGTTFFVKIPRKGMEARAGEKGLKD